MGAPQNYVSVSRRPPDIEDYIDMLRRYRSWIIGPMFAGLVISVVVAFIWPDTYVATATLRITPQQVPATLVPTGVETAIGQRLDQLEQQILSRPTLEGLITKPSLNLYRKERARQPMTDIVQNMRYKDIKITTVQEYATNGQRYTSAFQIKYSYPDKYLAKAVVDELVAKFTAENYTYQKEANNTTKDFVNYEWKLAKERMDSLESEITRFRAQNQGILPEQFQSNVQAMNTLEMNLQSLNDQLGRLQSDKMILDTRLNTLRHQENTAAANLETSGASQAVKNERLVQLNNQIVTAKQNLAGLRKIYKPGYPEIQRLDAEIAVLEKEKADAEKESGAQPDSTTKAPAKAVSPQVQAQIEQYKADEDGVRAQMKAMDLEIQRKTAEVDRLNKEIGAYRQRIEASPAKEQEWLQLQRDYQLAKSHYDQVSANRQLSDTQQDLEERQAGEKLEVLEAAQLPESPTDPNRWAISGIGSMVGLIIGIVLAGAREMKNTSLKNLKDVRAYTNLPVLSSIPLLENALLVRRKRRLFWLAWSSAIIIGTLVMGGAIYYHLTGGGTAA